MQLNTSNSDNSLQSFIYMRKLVGHPKLILAKQHPLYNEIITYNQMIYHWNVAVFHRNLKHAVFQRNIQHI